MCFNPPSTEDDAPTYVYVAVGSGVGIVVYILTIVLIGLVISLKIKGGYLTFTNCYCMCMDHIMYVQTDIRMYCTYCMYVVHTCMVCTYSLKYIQLLQTRKSIIVQWVCTLSIYTIMHCMFTWIKDRMKQVIRFSMRSFSARILAQFLIVGIQKWPSLFHII